MTKQVSGECDCCGEYRWLSQCWASEIETWACRKCQGDDEEEDDPDPDRARDDWLERQAEDKLHPEWNED
jgi:hypothetical protein